MNVSISSQGVLDRHQHRFTALVQLSSISRPLSKARSQRFGAKLWRMQANTTHVAICSVSHAGVSSAFSHQIIMHVWSLLDPCHSCSLAQH